VESLRRHCRTVRGLARLSAVGPKPGTHRCGIPACRRRGI